LGTPEQVRGLQWALDHHAPSRRHYKVYRALINELTGKHSEYDFIVMMLDLGQPVPTENLRAIAEFKEGLCCFVQPTPGQLLALSEVSRWGALSWDGVTFEEVAQKVDHMIREGEARIQKNAFLESATHWLKKSISRAGQIQLLNPPSHWSGFAFRSLDQSEGSLSLGQIHSKSKWKLPIPGEKDICEIFFHDGSWSLKILEPGFVSTHADVDSLRAGDQIQIGELRFLIKMDSDVEEIYSIARRLSIIDDSALESALEDELEEGPRVSFKGEDLESYCLSLLYSQGNGELQVRSGHRRGVITFYSGIITNAVAGAVDGLKALQRMLLWDSVEWHFVTAKDVQEDCDSMRVNLLQFTRLLQGAKRLHAKIVPFMPPLSLTLEVDALAFQRKEIWTIPEARVIASVAEYQMVRDILNYCPLPDLEIYETLINLRKQGLLRPIKAPVKQRREI
jgi:hypothetical protein